ncbi:MAG: hypothetical protein ACI88A_001372 [Paraglaciecola sp.]|jgi:hypothetical protein
MFTMIIAATTVHWQFGWQAITDPGAPFATERVMDAADKLAYVKEIVQQNADYDFFTSSGNLVMLNNGVEFAPRILLCFLRYFLLVPDVM